MRDRDSILAQKIKPMKSITIYIRAYQSTEDFLMQYRNILNASAITIGLACLPIPPQAGEQKSPSVDRNLMSVTVNCIHNKNGNYGNVEFNSFDQHSH
jgi:hypothetical protein